MLLSTSWTSLKNSSISYWPWRLLCSEPVSVKPLNEIIIIDSILTSTELADDDFVVSGIVGALHRLDESSRGLVTIRIFFVEN